MAGEEGSDPDPEDPLGPGNPFCVSLWACFPLGMRLPGWQEGAPGTRREPGAGSQEPWFQWVSHLPCSGLSSSVSLGLRGPPRCREQDWMASSSTQGCPSSSSRGSRGRLTFRCPALLWALGERSWPPAWLSLRPSFTQQY